MAVLRWLYAAAAWSTALVASAADLAVTPVRMELNAGQNRAAITVTNQGRETVTMQADIFSWAQSDNGDDIYAPSDDLLLNPAMFSIAPGESRVLRLGSIQERDMAREDAYRLFLREVPYNPDSTPSGAESPGRDDAGTQRDIRILLELRLPVYFGPRQVVRGTNWRARRDGSGTIRLEVLNEGNVHVALGRLRLWTANAPGLQPLAETEAGSTVLPGRRRAWILHPRQAIGDSRLVLEAATNNGLQKVALDLE